MFEVSFDNNSRNGEIPLTWLALVTTFDMTEMEVEEWANLSRENRKTVESDKQKCQVTIQNSILRDDNKLAWEFSKEEYGHEMSLNEKLEELEGITDEEEADSNKE